MHVIADKHTAWGKSPDIKQNIKAGGGRIVEARRYSPFREPSVGTHDYTTYSSRVHYNGNDSRLWNILERIRRK